MGYMPSVLTGANLNRELIYLGVSATAIRLDQAVNSRMRSGPTST
jgi:hypothetical protein